MKQLLIAGISLFISTILSAQDIKKIKITDLEKTIAGSNTPLIISFWASWCVPCIEEIPYFQEEVRLHNAMTTKADSIVLLLVSLDTDDQYPKGLKSVAKKRKITAPILWLDETNADYFCPKVDEKWSGAIPATLFINNKKGYRHFNEEQIARENFVKEIQAML